jgi:hypothetical protein
LFGREFKIFEVGSENKKGNVVLELDIDSAGFSDSMLLFEIKLLNGLSHEFKCTSGDEFSQWKRALSDYCGSRSSAVQTMTFTGLAKQLLCIWAQEQATEGLEQMLGPSDVGEVGAVEEAVGDAQSEDDEEDDFADDGLNTDFLGGGVFDGLE